MGGPRTDDDEFRRWFTTAGEHLDAARHTAEGGIHNWACVTAEQAAQAAIKALLHAVGAGDRARGHDLLGLAAACDEALGGSLSTDHGDALKRLYRHDQPARYPDGLPAGPRRTRPTPAPTPTRRSPTPRGSCTRPGRPTRRFRRRSTRRATTASAPTNQEAAMRVDAARVRERRRRERQRRLEVAGDVAADLAGRVELIAAVVVGSTARGDLADTSDVDVLVLAESLPEDFRRRAELVDPGRPGVEVIAWTVGEWQQRQRARNPLAVEARSDGVVLRGELPAA